MARPNLLYMSPIAPALTGNGLAMRAAMILEALASDYAVHLLVIPVVAGTTGATIDPAVAGWCTRIGVHGVAGREDALFRLIARIKDAGSGGYRRHGRLATRAFELVRANHSPERIRALLVQDHRTAVRERLRTSGLGAREAPPGPLSAGSSLDPT